MSLIIFDLVSTLINSGPRYVEAYMRVSEEYGQEKSPSRADMMKLLGEKNLRQIVAICSPQLGKDEIEHFMDDCNNMCDRMLTDSDWEEMLYPDTLDTLSSLHASGNTLGIFTGTREDAMKAQIFYHDILKYFDENLIEAKDNERDGHLNSAELKIHQLSCIADRYRAPHPDEPIIVVGDSASDFIAAQTVGLDFIGVARSAQAREKMSNMGVGTIVDSLTKICGIVSPTPCRHPFSPATRSVP